MLLTLCGHSYRYECENLCRLFFPYSKVRVDEPGGAAEGEPFAICEITRHGEKYEYRVLACDGKKSLEKSELKDELFEYGMTDLLYRTFSELTGYRPAWGMLTGIHPVKLLRMYEQQLNETEALEKFKSRCHVSDEKAQLALRVLRAQKPTVKGIEENDFSLYAGIPFCPTRCSYCSFISQDAEHAKKLMRPYFGLLLTELKKTAEVVKELGLSLRSVYIGGGTPTTLSAEELSALCAAIHESFDFSRCDEFTVEAGRPDTIDEEKLLALKEGGVDRISINPQSLSDKVLENIGRRHTVQDVYRAFELAQKAGFDNINADLIVGLPGDSLKGFVKSLNGVVEMGAASVTVHSLALKRSSRLVSEGENLSELSLHRQSGEVRAMVDYSIARLSELNYEPYYLYRQTRMAGNLENTGWAKPFKECRYNIYTMDESNTVIACGAGAVSKLKDPYSPDLKRVFNFKNAQEYITRFSEIIERKEQIREIYEQFRKRLY